MHISAQDMAEYPNEIGITPFCTLLWNIHICITNVASQMGAKRPFFVSLLARLSQHCHTLGLDVAHAHHIHASGRHVEADGLAEGGMHGSKRTTLNVVEDNGHIVGTADKDASPKRRDTDASLGKSLDAGRVATAVIATIISAIITSVAVATAIVSTATVSGCTAVGGAGEEQEIPAHRRSTVNLQ